jgi:rod shape determining protein RodA
MALTMQVEERTLFRRFDLNFALVVLALNLVGLINLYSATHGLQTVGLNRLFTNQIMWLFMGWAVFVAMTFVEYQILYRMAYLAYLINVLALLLVSIIGRVSYGARRWIDIGPIPYQPSETMKIALVLVLARYLASKTKPEGLGMRDLVWPLVLLLIPFGLTVKQPDLGTAMMLGFIFTTMILFVKVKRKILVACVLAISVAVPVAWTFGLKEYQKQRVLTFLEPGKDPRGAGYNSIQSKIAVGSGRFMGKGFRKGTQSQLEFLPERHTDFIFSVLSEEHGFVGSLTTVGLFCVLLLMGTGIATQARDKFGALLVVGILSYVFWHMFVNVGMVTGLLPIVGIPLPLLSYGGSGMLTTMLGLGIISSVSFRKYLF